MAKEYNVRASGVEGFDNGFYLQWYGDIGFGEYTIIVGEDGRWIGDSECMDRGEDKSFLEHLFRNIVESIEIVG